MPLKERAFNRVRDADLPNSTNEVGTKKYAPRGYSRVLVAIRHALGLTQPQMFDAICDVNHEFSLPDTYQNIWDRRRFATEEAKEKYDNASDAYIKTRSNATNPISSIENLEASIPFAVELRYARLINSRNGIIHLASAYYSDARDFCDVSKSEEDKSQALANLEHAAIGLNALSEKLNEFVVELRNGEDIYHLLANEKTKPIDNKNKMNHYKFILDLLEAYSQKPIDPIDPIDPTKSPSPAED